MRKDDKNKFLELYDKLPISIQDFLASDKMGVIIDDALNLGKVSSEKFSGIMDIITEILSFQLPKNQFRDELEKKINISPVAAQIVDKVIQEKVFKIFEKELSQYKPQHLEQKAPQETWGKEPIDNLTPQKITPITKEKTEEAPPVAKAMRGKEQMPSEQTIPEYSFPEPSEIKVEKPVSKIEELKKVVTPTISSEQQEKIRENLLAAMQKKSKQPKIVEEMRKVSLKPKTSKETKEEEKEAPGKIKIGELTSSKILSGEGKKFEDEEAFIKTEKEKPYILDVKLKEESSAASASAKASVNKKAIEDKQEKEKTSQEEPIPYKKYKKESPFGEA